MDLHDVNIAVCDGPPHKDTYCRRVDLHHRLLVVDSVLQNVFPSNHKDERRHNHLCALYSILTESAFDVARVVLNEMNKFIDSRTDDTPIPFGPLITDILSNPEALSKVDNGDSGPYQIATNEKDHGCFPKMNGTQWKKSLGRIRESSTNSSLPNPPLLDEVAGAEEEPQDVHRSPPLHGPPPVSVPPLPHWSMSYKESLFFLLILRNGFVLGMGGMSKRKARDDLSRNCPRTMNEALQRREAEPDDVDDVYDMSSQPQSQLARSRPPSYLAPSQPPSQATTLRPTSQGLAVEPDDMEDIEPLQLVSRVTPPQETKPSQLCRTTSGDSGANDATSKHELYNKYFIMSLYDGNILPVFLQDNVKDCPQGLYPVAMRACNKLWKDHKGKSNSKDNYYKPHNLY
ncbi:hypothetical protein RHMOL_Rhmol10G0218600 [Rhododendron molle]|uniref:Uncharacterized protein n=1 Tax=Rhododendron molle TaxID=49168 RepID=A0ACC0M4S8_RHOML|nr:hypothetical protein RHMOL_Rhmol10G0218600 [Rhododendron molle]